MRAILGMALKSGLACSARHRPSAPPVDHSATMQSVASTFAAGAPVAAKPQQRAAQAARAAVMVRAQKQEAVSCGWGAMGAGDGSQRRSAITASPGRVRRSPRAPRCLESLPAAV